MPADDYNSIASVVDLFAPMFPADLDDVRHFVRSASSARSPRDHFRRFLIQLADTPDAELPFADSGDTIATKVLEFVLAWNRQTLSPPFLESCTTLAFLVAGRAESPQVWQSLLDLLALFVGPQTPPHTTSPGSLIKQTPPRPNSGSCMTGSQFHRLIDPYIKDELRGVAFRDVDGFFDAFFDRWEWANVALELQCVPSFPNPATETAVLEWFEDFNNCFPLPQSSRYYTSKNTPLIGSSCARKCDIFLSPTAGSAPKINHRPHHHQHHWHDVLVLGELKLNSNNDATSQLLVQVAGYVREVFGAQSGRRFVHAFTISGDTMRCYIFDRAGAFSSPCFSVRDNPQRLIQILVAYSLMTATELGFDPTIKGLTPRGLRQSHQQQEPAIITVCGHDFQIDPQPIFYQPAIASRGTTVWRGVDKSTDSACVIKDMWRSRRHTSEGAFYELAKKRSVWGIPDCRYHEDVVVNNMVDEIHQNVRKGLDLQNCGVYSIPHDNRGDGIRSAGSRFSRGDTNEDNRDPKRSKPSAQEGATSIKPITSSSGQKDELSVLPLPDQQHPTKLSMRETPPNKDDDDQDHDKEEDGDGNDSDDDNHPIWDRTHTRLVLYTIGLPIYKFSSMLALLEAFRDAIKVHRSLVDANILHRDVSIDNIMITQNRAGSAPKGFLIDFDLAKDLSQSDEEDGGGSSIGDRKSKRKRKTSHPPHRTGTMEFMAIEVLRQTSEHSYRHDLESFFYVFLWLCTYYDVNNHPRPAPLPTTLNGWSRIDAAGVKVSQMCFASEFSTLTAGFSNGFELFKELAEEVRKVLFSPSVETRRGRGRGPEGFLGTLKNRDAVYDGIILAFENQIRKM